MCQIRTERKRKHMKNALKRLRRESDLQYTDWRRKKKMIALGSDHGGYSLKQEVKAYLEGKGIPYKDYGCLDESPCDYPVYAKAVAKAIVDGECDKGILICGTGIGISIAANKVKGIRAAVCHDTFSAQATRET